MSSSQTKGATEEFWKAALLTRTLAPLPGSCSLVKKVRLACLGKYVPGIETLGGSFDSDLGIGFEATSGGGLECFKRWWRVIWAVVVRRLLCWEQWMHTCHVVVHLLQCNASAQGNLGCFWDVPGYTCAGAHWGQDNTVHGAKPAASLTLRRLSSLEAICKNC